MVFLCYTGFNWMLLGFYRLHSGLGRYWMRFALD